MPEEINKYIDNKIANSLYVPSPEGFADKLMREIELSREFEMQDKKVNRSFRYVIAGMSVFVLSVVFVFSYYISSQLANEESAIGSNYNTITSYIKEFFSGSLSVLGITVSPDVFIYGFILIALIAAGSLVDRYMFRKSY
ncbi:MAG: hypothetical protein HY959_11470 [Ignavibacteriae bacterium]|nr:hypothetical protein [Ignavibacteriota bacterium]